MSVFHILSSHMLSWLRVFLCALSCVCKCFCARALARAWARQAGSDYLTRLFLHVSCKQSGSSGCLDRLSADLSLSQEGFLLHQWREEGSLRAFGAYHPHPWDHDVLREDAGLHFTSAPPREPLTHHTLGLELSEHPLARASGPFIDIQNIGGRGPPPPTLGVEPPSRILVYPSTRLSVTILTSQSSLLAV